MGSFATVGAAGTSLGGATLAGTFLAYSSTAFSIANYTLTGTGGDGILMDVTSIGIDLTLGRAKGLYRAAPFAADMGINAYQGGKSAVASYDSFSSGDYVGGTLNAVGAAFGFASVGVRGAQFRYDVLNNVSAPNRGVLQFPEASGRVPGRGGSVATSESALQGLTGKSAQVRNRAIQSAIREDLPNLNLTHNPVYDRYLQVDGLAIPPSRGGGTRIGPGAFEGSHLTSARQNLRSTIVHGELHHRWWKRGNPSPHHSPDTYVPDERFYEVLRRYNRLRGWE